jgi:hypothetical protein
MFLDDEAKASGRLDGFAPAGFGGLVEIPLLAVCCQLPFRHVAQTLRVKFAESSALAADTLVFPFCRCLFLGDKFAAAPVPLRPCLLAHGLGRKLAALPHGTLARIVSDRLVDGHNCLPRLVLRIYAAGVRFVPNIRNNRCME